MYTGRLSCVAFTFIPQGCKLFGLPSLDQDRLSFADFHFFAQCSDGGGQWFRTPCITLHRCIDARPRKDEDGYSQSFEDFVVSNEIEIYDYTDLEQCQTARAALGFDIDHPNDHEVCGQFNNTMCESHNWIFVSFFRNSLSAYRQAIRSSVTWNFLHPLPEELTEKSSSSKSPIYRSSKSDTF